MPGHLAKHPSPVLLERIRKRDAPVRILSAVSGVNTQDKCRREVGRGAGDRLV